MRDVVDLLTALRGQTIYRKDREVDLLFPDPRTAMRLAVEVKYQRVAGTADKKLPDAAKNLQTLRCRASSSTAAAASTWARCIGCRQ